jgi:sulfur dioxygenase
MSLAELGLLMTGFRQLFDPIASAYTYLLADIETRDAIAVDCVPTQTATVLAWLDELELGLRYVLGTHAHPGDAEGAAELRDRTGAKAVLCAGSEAPWAHLKIRDGDTIVFGNQVIHALGTPGHTPGCVCYVWRDRLFTGDALLIGGCGRTDLPGGDAGTLYDSVTRRLFLLPGETLVYPGHDHRGRTVSTIAEERQCNPCFAGKSRDEFITVLTGRSAENSFWCNAEFPKLVRNAAQQLDP